MAISADAKKTVHIRADRAFIGGLLTLFDKLMKLQREYMAVPNPAKRAQTDAEMRGLIDGFLGGGVCAGSFGDVPVPTLLGGAPAWCVLLLDLLDRVNREMYRANDPRILKYTKKYHNR